VSLALRWIQDWVTPWIPRHGISLRITSLSSLSVSLSSLSLPPSFSLSRSIGRQTTHIFRARPTAGEEGG
jgi:hypothetical protein